MTAAQIPESDWIGGCPVYGRARSPQECEKCGGDLLECPVYGDGERKRQEEDRAAAFERNEEWIEAITLALTWVPLSHYDEVQKRAERALGEMLDRIEELEKENASLRGYVATVASGVSRNDLLSIDKEFTDAKP